MGLFDVFWEILADFRGAPPLGDILTEKIGGGPHGYGDPDDWSIRQDEYYLFPRMVWRKVRYEICLPHFNRYYRCVAEANIDEIDEKCYKYSRELFYCKKYHYEDKNDEVELMCVKEYLKLRNEFRRTADPTVLQQMKEMMLTPTNQTDLFEVISKVNLDDKNSDSSAKPGTSNTDKDKKVS